MYWRPFKIQTGAHSWQWAHRTREKFKFMLLTHLLKMLPNTRVDGCDRYPLFSLAFNAKLFIASIISLIKIFNIWYTLNKIKMISKFIKLSSQFLNSLHDSKFLEYFRFVFKWNYRVADSLWRNCWNWRCENSYILIAVWYLLEYHLFLLLLYL